MNKKCLPHIIALAFSVFIALGPACAIVMAGGNSETRQSSQQTAPNAGGTQAQQAVPTVQAEPVQAVSTLWTGDGGKAMSLGIQVPAGQGLNAALSNIPSMVQGCLVYNIRKYSAISVLDPVALDKVITETLDPKYKDNLDIVRLGQVAHVGYWMTGKIIETPYGYTLQFNVTDTTPAAKTLAAYNGNCTASQLIDQSAIQLASMELLAQMGVQLSAAAKNELSTTNTQQSIKAQSFLANSRTAEREGGSDIEVYFNAVLAAKFDPALPEATSRSAILAANISSERTGDNLREDVRWRNEWVARLAETEKYVKSYNDYYNKYYTDYCNDFYKKYTDNWNKFIQDLPELPYTLFYTANAEPYGGTNYNTNTTSYTGIQTNLHASQKWIQDVQTAIRAMDAPVGEVQRTVQAEQAAVQAAIREVVKTVNDGLEATGQRTKWGLQPLNVGVTAVPFDNGFVERRRQKQGTQTFSVAVELVNSQNNKVLGRSTFQTGGTYAITNRGLSVSGDEQKSVNFTNVNINDIPPSDDLLTIRIASVNGTPAETAIKNGVLQITALSGEQWNFYNSFEIKNGVITKYSGKRGTIVIADNIWGDIPVTAIGDGVFANNWLTGELIIPNGVTSIGDGAFQNNYLTGVTIPDSVTSIGVGAFSNNGLASVTIGNSVTSIGNNAFASNLLTGELIIPNSVTSIGAGAFSNNRLTGVTIPNSVTSIGLWAFVDNPGLAIHVSSGNPHYSSKGSVLYYKNGTAVEGLGALGPGGGKIFYYSEAGFTMTDNGQVCHYLEAAPAIMPALAWASRASIPRSSGGTGIHWVNITGTLTAIGSGRKNTALILAKDNAPAANACKDYRGGGKTDWFLPSRDELNELYKNRAVVGNMGTGWYWSSSQGISLSSDLAWLQSFSGGSQGPNLKNGAYYVRAVRAF